ncbi:MAG: hypothetical protein KGH83_03650 [Thaumarchaeota archaeon]|nr:hypothetical protein [Nitrososphaerota archaeon]
MASLEILTKSYKAKKIEVAKLRRKSENNLKAVLSTKRRSSSGLASLARRNESLGRQIEHVAQLLNQHLAQKESISRLKIAAEERLRQEQDAQDNAKQQSEYGGPEEKAAAQERLKFIDEKIIELHAQLKEREAIETRLAKQIESLHKEKAKLDSQLRKQIHTRPGLLEQLKSSQKAELVLRPRVQSLIKREAQTTKALQSMEKRLEEVMAQRRKATRRAKKKSRKSRVKKRRVAKTKKSAGKKTKRTKTRTRKAKTKMSRKKAVRRKVAKRKITKRKAKARRSKSKRR